MNNVYLSKTCLNMARERVPSLKDLDDDGTATVLRKALAVSERLPDDEVQSDDQNGGVTAMVMPSDLRTVKGDRAVILLRRDEYSRGEEYVALTVKPLRSIRKVPAREVERASTPCEVNIAAARVVTAAEADTPERIGRFPTIPTVIREQLDGPRAVVVETTVPALTIKTELVPPSESVEAPNRNGRSKRASPTKNRSAGMSRGAALLRNELLVRGLTVKAAAVVFGVSSWNITRWQTGQQLPDLKQAATLERAAGIPMRAWSESL